MSAFVTKRLGLALLVGLAVSAGSFFLLPLSGAVAAAIAGEAARQEDIELIRSSYGLDRPMVLQYVEWLWRTMRGDFGTSLYFKTEVVGLIWGKLPTTMLLGIMSLTFALIVSIPLGVFAAVFHN